MKTTELFAEQVLIGLLVTLMVGLVFISPLRDFYHAHVNSNAEQLVADALIIGTAYLIGMVYDRVCDTLLQDLESHCRLQFALQGLATRDQDVETEPPSGDPFPDGEYRIHVLANAEATGQMEYLRSRIRLTRAMATAMPGLTLAVLLAIVDRTRVSNVTWTAVATTLPVSYLLVLSLKLFWRRKRPPKTYELADRPDYVAKAGPVSTSAREAQQVFHLLYDDEVWAGLLLVMISGAVLIVSSGVYGYFWILLAGLVLTLIVGWSWWRVSITFYAFLRSYDRYGYRIVKSIV